MKHRWLISFCLLLLAGFAFQAQSACLRFYGNGVGDIDRVKIRVDDPGNSLPGPPADIGATDFTIEFWIRGALADNSAGPITPGVNVNWINGNIVFDRDRYNQDRKFGISLGAGRVAFGVSGQGTGDRTIVGTTNTLDGQWHHIAIQRRRSDGYMWVYVDGVLDASADGPNGDISYPDNGIPGNYCNGPCSFSDPFIVIGAEKHDAGPEYPSYNGYFDEMRLSNTLRYSATFIRPASPFTPDASTAALYHFDEGTGNTIGDEMGQSPAVRSFGGDPAGPVWALDSPFSGLSSIGLAKLKADGQAVVLDSRRVTFASSSVCYLQEDNRSAGIRVVFGSGSVTVGNRVSVWGTMATNAEGERYIEASYIGVAGSVLTTPLKMNNRTVGGDDWNYSSLTGAGQSGISEAVGLNNVGLLVQVAGRVSAVTTPDRYTIEDGSGVLLQVIEASSLPAAGTFVSQPGIVRLLGGQRALQAVGVYQAE